MTTELQTLNSDSNTDRDSRLAALAAQLLGIAVQHAQQSSSAAAIAEATRLHDTEGLYPHLSITAPHGGGAVRLELTLRDPDSDAMVVSMFCSEAAAITPAWTH